MHAVGMTIIAVSLLLIGAQVPVQSKTSAQFPNLFAFKACLSGDPEFCPGGQFDQNAFNQMYANPAANATHYPSGGTGPYVRRVVPACENAPCAPEELIRCTDGTRPIYKYKEGAGIGVNKWIIKIQGGGVTCDTGDCGVKYFSSDRDHFSSAYGRNPERSNALGILSTRSDNLFRNFNLVILDKCVGDRNLGDVAVADYQYAPGVTGPVYFHGFLIIKALLQDLRTQAGTTPDLEDAELIVFLTQSNGSNGGYLYMDRLRDFVLSEIAAPGHVPDVRYLASGFIRPGPEVEYALNHQGTFPASASIPYSDVRGHVDDPTVATNICGDGYDPATPSYQAWMNEGRIAGGGKTCLFGVGKDDPRGIGSMYFSTAEYREGKEAERLALWGATDATPTIDASCYQAHQSTGDTEACNDSTHMLLYHLTTPTFFGAQVGDRKLRTGRLSGWTTVFDPLYCDTGDPNCHSENFRGDLDHEGNPRPSEGAWQKEDFRKRVLQIMHERFKSRSPHQEQPDGVGHGAFIDNTVDHMGFSEISKLRRTMRPLSGADALELQEYLRQWFDPADRRPVVCIDEGPLYDIEFMPSVLMPDAPPELQCASGAYHDPNKPMDPQQGCNDPYPNIASPLYVCLETNTDNKVYMPLITG